MSDPLAGYRVGWQDEPQEQDPLADYTPDWRKKKAAPVATAPEPAVPPLEPVGQRPTPPKVEHPAWDRFGEPTNEAARDVEEAQRLSEPEPTEAERSMSTRTRAFGFGLGLAKGTLGMLLFPAQVGLEYAREITGQAFTDEMLRAEVARQHPEVAPQPTESQRFAAGLNPLPLIGALGRREPEAFGELGGMLLGGHLFGEALRHRPGAAVAERAPNVGRPGAPDPFVTLGLNPRTATAADVEAAFREAAMRTHPDVTPDVRAERGGPTNPVQAAMAFNEASAARDAALEYLGQGRPVQETRAPEAPPSPRRAAPEPPQPETPRTPVAPSEPSRWAPKPPAPEVEPTAQRGPVPQAVEVPTDAEARRIGNELRDLTLQKGWQTIPELQDRYTQLRALQDAYNAAHPLPPPETPELPPREVLAATPPEALPIDIERARRGTTTEVPAPLDVQGLQGDLERAVEERMVPEGGPAAEAAAASELGRQTPRPPSPAAVARRAMEGGVRGGKPGKAILPQGALSSQGGASEIPGRRIGGTVGAGVSPAAGIPPRTTEPGPSPAAPLSTGEPVAMPAGAPPYIVGSKPSTSAPSVGGGSPSKVSRQQIASAAAATQEEVKRETAPEAAPTGGPVPAPARGEPAGEPTGPAPGAPAERATPSAPEGGRAGERAGPPVPRRAPEEARPVQPEEAREPAAVREQPERAGAGAGAARPGAGAVAERPTGPAGQPYRISEADHVGESGPVQRVRDNLDALETLRRVESEGRPATPAEQAALVKYSGWGHTPQIFNLQHPEWGEHAARLRELLTDEEYAAAKASTPNAHYTSPLVVGKIFEALKRLGLSRGRALEPSAGIGHFLGIGPAALKWSAVELDGVASRILKQLYPNADVRAGGFETQALADNFYDGAISNVPFGDYPVHDPLYNKHAWPIHNYFIVKMLDKVKPGGLVVAVTSNYAMDAPSHEGWRQYVARQASLLGAIRLPNTAFKKNAGTEVTTDILFLQKKPAAEGAAWTLTQGSPTGQLNQYYAAHPDMMLGKMALTGTQYRGNEPTLEPIEGQDLGEALDAAIAQLPQNVVRAAPPMPTDQATGAVPATGEEPQGSYLVQPDGKLVQRQGAELVPVTGTRAGQIKEMARLRDATREVLRTQAEDEPQKAQDGARRTLNGLYDKFVRKHGPLGQRVKSGAGERRPNLEPFRDDPDVSLLAALEEVNEETGAIEKAAIFTERVIERQPPLNIEKPDDALLAVLNERGVVDLPRIAHLLGQTEAQARAALGGLVFEDPVTETLETADNYLSGNVRKKLVLAKQAAKVDEKYRENVTALEAVQPVDKPPSKIAPALGASWIPAEDVQQFVGDLLAGGYGRGIRVSYLPVEAAWSITAPHEVLRSVAARKEWGTERVGGVQLIEDALNQVATTIRDRHPDDPDKTVVNEKETTVAREIQQRIRDRFAEWVWEDPSRSTRLHRVYNDQFNNWREGKYDGSHLTLPGSSAAIRLLPHQKNAVWRGLQQRKLGLFHAVGAGKTYVGAATLMEAKRLGLLHKPMVVVPNHMIGQWQRDFLKLYPAARLLIADDRSFSKAGPAARKEFVARVATGNWDAVVITHSSFSRIPMSRQFELEFIREQLGQYEEAAREAKQGRNRDLTKLIEKGKKRLQTRIKQIENREAKDELLPFEQLGVDGLFVDESQAYKNLYFMTKMRNVPGSGQLTQRSMDMYLKTRYLDRSQGRLIMATGTPISNTISEMYTLQRYLQPDVLAELGLAHFDAWAATFGQTKQVFELSPAGGYRTTTRFAYFKNVSALVQQLRAMADVKVARDLNLPKPRLRGNKATPVAVPGTAELAAFVATLVERAKLAKARQVAPEVDNMLKITHEGRFAALDMRLMSPGSLEAPTSKLNVAAEKILAIWRDTGPQRLTQLAFINAVKPGNPHFDVYGALKEKLMAGGMPVEEIAFAHDAKTDLAKEALFRKVREGRVRVLLGSIFKMGVGTNVQDRLLAMHELDPPWRPADIEQGRGRILRRGNTNPEVQIYSYLAEGSFDAYMWQTLERKAEAIEQLMTADADTDTIEDVDGDQALTYAEMKAIASGNPLVMEKAKVDGELNRLAKLSAAHKDRQFNIRQDLALTPERITALEAMIAGNRTDEAALTDVKGDRFTVTVQGTTFTERALAAERILAVGRKLAAASTTEYKQTPIGTFAGLELMIATQLNAQTMLGLQGQGLYQTVLPETGEGVAKALDYLPKRIGVDLQNNQDRLAGLERSMRDLERLKDEAFPHQAELDRLQKRALELNAQLDLDKSDAQAGAREVTEIPEEGTADAQEEADPADLEEAVERMAEREHPEKPDDREPDIVQRTGEPAWESLREKLKASGFDPQGLTDAELAKAALEHKILDDVTERDLIEQVARFLEERGAGMSTLDVGDVPPTAGPGTGRVYRERPPRAMGFFERYFMPSIRIAERMTHSDRPDVVAIGLQVRDIVDVWYDAYRADARFRDHWEKLVTSAMKGLEPRQLDTLTRLLDKTKVEADLPAGTDPRLKRAFSILRPELRRHWRLLGANTRLQLSQRSRALIDRALERWPEGTPAPDFDNEPVNSDLILEAADELDLAKKMPQSREDWERLAQAVRNNEGRVPNAAFLESEELQTTYHALRGEGGIEAYLPHVMRGPWNVEAGPFSKRFVDPGDAQDYARDLLTTNQWDRDITIRYDQFVPDYATYLGRGSYMRLRSELARQAEADAITVTKAMAAAKVRQRPRAKRFAHSMRRLINLQTFEKDPRIALQIYGSRLSRKLAFDPAMRASTDRAEQLPAVGGWRDWALGYIADVSGQPHGLMTSIENSLQELTGYRLRPMPFQRAASAWQSLMSIFKLGLSLPSALNNLTQTAINTVPRFRTNGHAWVWRGVRDLVVGSEESLDVLDQIGVRFQHPKNMVGEFLPIGKQRGITAWAMWMFNKSEYVNRGIAALARYAEQRAAGLSKEGAIKSAADFVRETQFDYANTDVPTIMRNPIGRAFLQFKTYGLNELFFAEDLLRWGTPRQKLTFGLYLWVLGGLSLLMGGGAINWLVGKTGLLHDKAGHEVGPWDKLWDELGDVSAQPLLAGAKYGLLGLFGIDMSQRLSFADQRDFTTTLPTETVKQLARLLGSNTRTEREAAARQLAPAAVARLLQAYEMAVQGRQRDSYGNTVNAAPSTFDIASKALGFRTVTESERSDRVRREKAIVADVRAARTSYLDRAAEAMRRNNQDDLTTVLNEAAQKGVYFTMGQIRQHLESQDSDLRRRVRATPKSERGNLFTPQEQQQGGARPRVRHYKP